MCACPVSFKFKTSPVSFYCKIRYVSTYKQNMETKMSRKKVMFTPRKATGTHDKKKLFTMTNRKKGFRQKKKIV